MSNSDWLNDEPSAEKMHLEALLRDARTAIGKNFAAVAKLREKGAELEENLKKLQMEFGVHGLFDEVRAFFRANGSSIEKPLVSDLETHSIRLSWPERNFSIEVRDLPRDERFFEVIVRVELHEHFSGVFQVGRYGATVAEALGRAFETALECSSANAREAETYRRIVDEFVDAANPSPEEP